MRARLGIMRATLTAVLALTLMWTGRPARAQLDGGIFAPNVQWSGFSQSLITNTTRGTSRLTIATETGSQFTGNMLFLGGRSYAYQGAFSLDGGVLALMGVGTGAEFQAHGRFVPLGAGNFVATMNYQIAGTGDQGVMQLLHIRALSAGFSAFPPGPCNGAATDSAGLTEAIQYQRIALSADARTTGFPGTLTIGANSYVMVGTISSTPNADGTYSTELMGMLSTPVTFIPCVVPPPATIHITGSFLSGGVTGAQNRLTGQYSLLNTDNSLYDNGSFTMTQ
jgi:hypothetical protein